MGMLARLVAATFIAAVPLRAWAAPLTIVNVAAPGVNCVFNASCQVTVTDSIHTFTLPDDRGTGLLQTRSFVGAAPAQAAGLTAYLYRIDLSDMTGLAAVNCVSRIDLDFGPVLSLHYVPGSVAQIFVVSTGGLGSTGPSAALQTGNWVTLYFKTPVCPGQSSYFFGLTARNTAGSSTATLTRTLGGTVTAGVHVPKH